MVFLGEPLFFEVAKIPAQRICRNLQSVYQLTDRDLAFFTDYINEIFCLAVLCIV